MLGPEVGAVEQSGLAAPAVAPEPSYGCCAVATAGPYSVWHSASRVGATVTIASSLITSWHPDLQRRTLLRTFAARSSRC